MDLLRLTIEDILNGYRLKSFKPSEVVQAFSEAISRLNPKLNSFLEVQAEASQKRARELDNRVSEIDSLPLFGIPIAIKDNFLVKGWRATAGSKILANYVAPYTATTVERLEASGAIVIGKANCDEFAMGSSNENSAFGPVRNPWDFEKVPGGSSGGSAAAVAAGLSAAALGTDTGGSIRQPASLCGLVGLKPSYGRVSRYGIVAYASSLDQVGPFAKTVWDAARVLEVMAGQDPNDATSSSLPVPTYTKELGELSLKGKILGVPRDWLAGVDPDVLKSYEDALQTLQSLGATILDIGLPHTRYALSTYYLIAPSECSSNLARFDGVHYGHRTASAQTGEELYMKSRGEGFGREVKMRIMLGTYALSSGYYDAYYVKANQVRKQIQKDFEEAFQKCHGIVTPTSPSTAFALGAKTEDPIKMYLNDIFTLPVNLAGLPGVSVPCGLDRAQLPIGLQFIGSSFGESSLLQMAFAYEKARGVFPSPKIEVGGRS